MNILMLAIATQRFRVPLMWTVLDKAGASNQCERIVLMRRYLALFGSGSIAWLLADREFIGGRWIKFLLENNVLFAIRVKENSILRLEDGRCYQLKSLLRKPAGLKRLQSQLARLAAMDESLGTPLRFAAKRLGDGELLIVASNGPAKLALKAYRRRWQIECLFGDSKTRGLNMEDTRLTQPAQAQHPAGHHHPGHGLGLCLCDSHQGDQVDQDPGPRLPLQIVVPSRLRSAQKVDPTPD